MGLLGRHWVAPVHLNALWVDIGITVNFEAMCDTKAGPYGVAVHDVTTHGEDTATAGHTAFQPRFLLVLEIPCSSDCEVLTRCKRDIDAVRSHDVAHYKRRVSGTIGTGRRINLCKSSAEFFADYVRTRRQAREVVVAA